MASLKQIEANQRNAQQSTGPRTEEGKAVSRYNSLKSGIDAAAEAALPSESFHDLALLKNEYLEHFQPRNPEQRCLVDTLISSEWLLRRFRRIEGELLTRSCKDLKQSEERFCLGNAFDENARSLERLQRRVNATQRTYVQTLKLLKELQDADKPQPLRRLPAAQVQPAQPLPAPIGFVPPSPETARRHPSPCDADPALRATLISCPCEPMRT